jgi:putative sterol carrier protein
MVVRAPRTLDEAAQWLRRHFQPEAARGLCAVVGIDLSGPGGGNLSVSIDGGGVRVESIRAGAPDLLLRTAASDYYAILAGRENAELLFMAGRMEIEGDLALAMKLRTLFPARA